MKLEVEANAVTSSSHDGPSKGRKPHHMTKCGYWLKIHLIFIKVMTVESRSSHLTAVSQRFIYLSAVFSYFILKTKIVTPGWCVAKQAGLKAPYH